MRGTYTTRLVLHVSRSGRIHQAYTATRLQSRTQTRVGAGLGSRTFTSSCTRPFPIEKQTVMSADLGPARSLASLLSDVATDWDTSPANHKVAIALGSNLGDRFANIELALRLLENPRQLVDPAILGENAEVAVVDTSFMYETEPMYMTDQPSFINCACMIQTNIEPRALLSLLKAIEGIVGRVPSVRNGPRAVDLDILLYDSDIIDTRPEDERRNLENLEGHLVVPHPRMKEREFVLRPLNDMVPNFTHPDCNISMRNLLDRVASNQTNDVSSMQKVVPFPRYPLISPSTNLIPGFTHPVPPTANYWTITPSYLHAAGRKTHIMAILNATPDSFSDGSLHNSLPAALSYVRSSVTAGADIIDIGGYSTRPGATFVTQTEEISRVVPIVQAVRGIEPSVSDTHAKAKDVLISVDTFRPEVAEAGILTGANCINDIYAFTGQDYPLNRTSAKHLLAMRKIARDLAVPVVLMHSRGDAGSNKDYKDYIYAQDAAVLEGIRVELGEKVDSIVKGKNGIRRWFIMVDPGVGFSKTREDNLEILRHAALITKTSERANLLAGYPQLIGASRKSFLGAILAEADKRGTYQGRPTEARERGWATAAAVACAVQQEATVVRVHDVLEMGDAVRVASALWG